MVVSCENIKDALSEYVYKCDFATRFFSEGSIGKCDLIMIFISTISEYKRTYEFDYKPEPRSSDNIAKEFIQNITTIIKLLKKYSSEYEVAKLFIPFAEGIQLGISTSLSTDIISREVE